MTERKRIHLLVLIMALASLSAAGISIFVLYRAALNEQRTRLVETAQSQGRLIEAVARFSNIYHKDYPGGAVSATLSQIIDAHKHYKGFGETGEFTLGKRDGNDIVFLLSHRHYDLNSPKPVPLDSKLAEPMRRALKGLSGTAIAPDYRGELVLAAYEPVSELGLGIVAKIDLAEIRAPFIRAALMASVFTSLIVIVGAISFKPVSDPIIQHLAKTNQQLEVEVGERKQVEEELRKSRDTLELRVRERTAKLEIRNQELQDFTFVASHDLQEPLRKIRTFGDMLAGRCGASLDEASRDYLARMLKAATRMQNLINSLLAYSRLTRNPDPMRETDLGKSVKTALSNLRIMIQEKKARVELGELPTIRADRVQMVQLFQNVIGNALKFSRGGVTPHVRIYAREGLNSNGAYEICVEDNGIGFEEKYLDRIFLPFQTLYGMGSEYRGVGMGLAICKKIVEHHGGRISAASEVGKGSTFIVELTSGEGDFAYPNPQDSGDQSGIPLNDD